MKLSDFAGILPVDGAQLGDIDIAGFRRIRASIGRASLFFAVPGTKADGAAYAADAVSARGRGGRRGRKAPMRDGLAFR